MVWQGLMLNKRCQEWLSCCYIIFVKADVVVVVFALEFIVLKSAMHVVHTWRYNCGRRSKLSFYIHQSIHYIY